MEHEPERVSLIVLRAARQLETGKLRLVSFLKGSKSRETIRQGLDRVQGYGALLWKSTKAIEDYVDQLKAQGLLQVKTVSGPEFTYPVLILSERGRAVLEEGEGVTLVNHHPVELVKKNQTTDETVALIREGLTPEQVAKKRGLVLSTVYDHLYRAVAVGEIRVGEFLPLTTARLVREAKSRLPPRASLSDIKQALPDSISYGEIRCVIAELEHEKRNVRA